MKSTNTRNKQTQPKPVSTHHKTTQTHMYSTPHRYIPHQPTTTNQVLTDLPHHPQTSGRRDPQVGSNFVPCPFRGRWCVRCLVVWGVWVRLLGALTGERAPPADGIPLRPLRNRCFARLHYCKEAPVLVGNAPTPGRCCYFYCPFMVHECNCAPDAVQCSQP